MARGPIKGVLAEELRRSSQMKKAYERDLRRLPAGCLVERVISGRSYVYLVKREKGRVKSFYIGKMADAKKRRYAAAKKKRAQLRHLLSRVKKQIRYLEGVLRGKEPI
jgi:hypothetical protein